MIKGDKIKLVKSMGIFTNIGEICEVIDVTNDGVISFRFGNGKHLGCMSYNEFEKYFELVNNSWTNWTEDWIKYYDLDGFEHYAIIYIRHNNKIIQAKTEDGLIKSECTCSTSDTFDIKIGYKLAKKRLIVKLINKELDEYVKTL